MKQDEDDDDDFNEDDKDESNLHTRQALEMMKMQRSALA